MFRISLLLLGLFSSVNARAAGTTTPATDLVVYGATASGVFTAYSAAREGLHVVLLEPDNHVGGMVTGGLSATDIGNPKVIGGYARDFYLRAA
ncbi:MAG: FAD-dependent oxidoreductase, partial [Bryocella sp.]